MRRRARLTAATLAIVATMSWRAVAAPPTRPLVVTKDDAVSLGATQGPGVAIERAPRAAAGRAIDVANPPILVPPRITVNTGRRTGTFGSGLEVSVTAVEEVPLRRVGREREQAAESLRRVADQGIRSVELDAASRAALAWVMVLERKHTLALRHESRTGADDLLRIARLRMTSGVGMPIELATANGERGVAAAAELDAEGMLTEALFELRYATGLRADTPVDVHGQLEPIAHGEPDELVLARLARETHPTVALATARADLAAQESRLVYASRAPTIGLGASYLHEGTGNEVWSAVMVVPFPLGDFGAFDRARQDVGAARTRAEVDLVRHQLERDVNVALHERQHARATYQAFVTGAREPMREALRLARAQYEAGPGDLAAVLVARQRLVSAEEQVTRAAANVQRADIKLARASGTLLDRGQP